MLEEALTALELLRVAWLEGRRMGEAEAACLEDPKLRPVRKPREL